MLYVLEGSTFPASMIPYPAATAVSARAPGTAASFTRLRIATALASSSARASVSMRL